MYLRLENIKIFPLKNTPKCGPLKKNIYMISSDTLNIKNVAVSPKQTALKPSKTVNDKSSYSIVENVAAIININTK